MSADLEAARKAAEAFRAKFIQGRPFEHRRPLDVVFIASNVLRLDLVEFPGLEKDFGSSAYVTADLKELYVDEVLSISYSRPGAPNWQKDRLRFSVAHELGHIHMHHAQLPKLRCKQMGDLKTLFNSTEPWRDDVEAEANEFAGRLISPLNELEKAHRSFGDSQDDPRWRDSSELRDRFCDAYGARIGLHPKGVGARLTREKLWPAEWTYGG